MPTGTHLHDPRRQLFDAAERVLLRDGPNALTSRAVTDEANCAKGVLHRHFTDFDAFLTDLVLDRAAQLRAQAATLRETAGTGTIADNLTHALTTLFAPTPMAIIPLITFRDELRKRLRHATPGGGIAILSEATTAISAYLTDERHHGRITPHTDINSLTLSLVGGGHLLFTDHAPDPPTTTEIHTFVTAAITDAVQPHDNPPTTDPGGEEPQTAPTSPARSRP